MLNFSKLGSALVAHILSNQPTKMPRISQLPKQVISETRDRFLFNISNLFLVGSPLGIFLHLEQAQLMPRKGRERTMRECGLMFSNWLRLIFLPDSPADEAVRTVTRHVDMIVDLWLVYCSWTVREDLDAWRWIRASPIVNIFRIIH